VGDADDALQVLGERRALHLRHAPHAAHAPDAAVEHRDAGGVIAAVLEALQALGEDGHDIPVGDRSDDSAHGLGARRGSDILSCERARDREG
jgi:hypothetical protein